MLESYEKIPKVLRWIIYIPVVLLASFIALAILGVIHTYFARTGIGAIGLQFLMAIFTAIIVVTFSYHLAPNYKFASSVIFFSIISLLQIFAVVRIAAKFFYPDMEHSLQDAIDFIIVCIWFGVGVPYLISLKKNEI